MAINLDNVKAITHNNKDVIKIEDSNGNIIWEKESGSDVIYYSNYNSSTTPVTALTYQITNDTWFPQSWNFDLVRGNEIWTDGTDIFWNGSGIGAKVLNQNTMEWEEKSWPEFTTTWSGNNVFKFNGNIYYSSGADHRIYNKALGVWEDASTMFPGLPASFEGSNFWNDGEDDYYSQSNNQYIFNKTTQRWTSKSWSGLSGFSAYHVWTNGTYVYCLYQSKQYRLNKSTSTWSQVPTYGTKNYNGTRTFKYGGDIYLLENASPYEMYKLNNAGASSVSWTKVDFANHPTYGSSIRGDYMWSLNGRVTASCVSYTTK